MKKLKVIGFWLWQFTWGFAQNLVGLCIYIFCRVKYPTGNYKCARALQWKGSYGSLSLGCFLFVTNINNEELLAHEYGHSLQSMILGPLWVFVIGFPSLIWAACFGGWRKKNNRSYDEFYTESWANKLGGVK